jgi:hypothetical protein
MVIVITRAKRHEQTVHLTKSTLFRSCWSGLLFVTKKVTKKFWGKLNSRLG